MIQLGQTFFFLSPELGVALLSRPPRLPAIEVEYPHERFTSREGNQPRMLQGRAHALR